MRVAIYMQMIKYISREEAVNLIEESVRIGVEPDRERLRFTAGAFFCLYFPFLN